MYPAISSGLSVFPVRAAYEVIALWGIMTPAAYTTVAFLMAVASSSEIVRSSSVRCHSFETTRACLIRDLVLDNEVIQHDYEYNRSLSGFYLSGNQQDPVAVRLDTGSGVFSFQKRSPDHHSQEGLLQLGDGDTPILFVFRCAAASRYRPLAFGLALPA